MCHTPIVIWGLDVTLIPFVASWRWKNLEKTGISVTNRIYWLQYSPNGGDQWLHSKPWTTSIRQCTQYCAGASAQLLKRLAIMVHFFIVVLFAVALAAAGNTTWILTRWRRLVASGLAMDPLHWRMPAVSYRRISSAVKTGRIGGAFDHCWRLWNCHNHS